MPLGAVELWAHTSTTALSVPFPSDFWVAAATAAPVIALSSIVVVNDNLKAGISGLTVRRSSPYWFAMRKRGIRAAVASSASTLIQAFALLVSLESLIDGKNAFDPIFIALAEVLGLAMVFSATVATGVMSVMAAQYRLEENEERSKIDPSEDGD
jgi:hypothetical protein